MPNCAFLAIAEVQQGEAMTAKNALYAQSGGVTPVINVTAAAVIEEARRHPDAIARVLAARNGILGVLRESLYDTSGLSEDDLKRMRQTPGGVFGSCRFKLGRFSEHKAQYERLIEVFQAHDIGYFFYNGGGDSADTALKVSALGEKMGYPITCIAVPKTIDNDLPITDNSPGFASAAKYVAVSTLEASLDVQAMADTSTKVFIFEVMGRHAGWLAASAGVVQREPDDPPHVILMPERRFDENAFLRKVKQVVDRVGYCTVVASEGVKDADGQFLSEQPMLDAFGHPQLGGVAPVLAQLVREKLGLKNHWAVADYLQRSARHIASQVDVDQAEAVGRAAVRMALEGKNALMPVIRRLSDAPYRWEIGEGMLADIANVEQMMPDDFIAEDGMGITEKARRYFLPLLAGEAYPQYRQGLPLYLRLDCPLVQRFLPEYEQE